VSASIVLQKKPRRTQQERREATISKLLDATIEALLAVGYARTTVKEICARAGLSHGALFRFFPSVLDLVLAAGEEVARRQIAEFERRFAQIEAGEDPITAALLLLRAACRSPTNAVFYELLLAARTDPKLRRALRASMRTYYDAIRRAALSVPGVEAIPAELIDSLVFTAVHLFDGETLARSVLSLPHVEESRIALLRFLVARDFPAAQSSSARRPR
jgi:AcrR family transcriptional regulator